VSTSRGSPAPAAVVFDLDDTLFDAYLQCVVPAHREAAIALRAAGLHAPLETIVALREALGDAPLDLDLWLARSFGAREPERLAAAGRRAFLARDPGPVVPFPFARDVLRRVRAHAQAVLLTAGDERTQRLKLERLGLGDLLAPQVVVAPGAPGGKRVALTALLERLGLPAARVLVVGDRPSSEIAAARAVGCPALRIRSGEHVRRPTPPAVPEAADVRAVLGFFPPAVSSPT
jgi:FMN phosphatase YigB (HAD superfamily)